MPFLLSLLGSRYFWAALACVGMVGYASYWHISRVNRAVEAERAKWVQQAEKDRIAYKAELDRLTAAVKAQEAEYVSRMAAIGANYVKGLKDAEAIRLRDIAAARGGTLKLRVPASVCATGPGSPAEASPPASGGNGAATVELPQSITSDLFEFANDADQVADQLRACQKIVLSDRIDPQEAIR